MDNPFKAMSANFPIEAYWLARCFQVGHDMDQVFACTRMARATRTSPELASHLDGAHFRPWQGRDDLVTDDSYKELNDLASEFLDSIPDLQV